MFNFNKAKSRKYFLLLLLFSCASIFGLLIGNRAIIAQIKSFYSENSDNVAGLNSLMSAVAANDISGVRFFSKAGTALINQKNIGGATPLHIACREKNFEISSFLVENGADVNSSDNEGWTPLMRASLVGASNIVELLLSKNADASKLNSIEESAIVMATKSDCIDCLKLMFEKFNFIKVVEIESLKSQLNQAFIIARNHENQEIQIALENYLDQVVKMSTLVNKQNFEENSGEISINQDNQLNLITKNRGSFVERDLSESNNQKGKGKFKFVGESSKESFEENNDYQTFIINEKSYKTGNSKFISDGKNNKFIIKKDSSSQKSSKNYQIEENKNFKPNDSNAVFLKNSKVDNRPVTEILKSKKFRFLQGIKPQSENHLQETKAKIDSKNSFESFDIEDGGKNTPIPPVLNNFKILKGPSGAKVQKTEQSKDLQESSKSSNQMRFKFSKVTN